MDEHTPVGDQLLHTTVDRNVTALSKDDEGKLLATPTETDEEIEEARSALATYRDAQAQERTLAADVLAEALQGFLDWPKQSPAERKDFGFVLYALEMARYQHGGTSRYLDSSPFRRR